jgi:hypothetical protein
LSGLKAIFGLSGYTVFYVPGVYISYIERLKYPVGGYMIFYVPGVYINYIERLE